MQPNDTRIKTQNGDITLEMTGGAATNNSRGLALDNQSIQLLSNTGTITIRDRKPIGLTGSYNGLYLKPSAANAILFGADGSEVLNSSSDVIIEADKATFDGTTTRINTAGAVSIVSADTSFGSILNYQNINIENTATGLTIGKPTNTADVTIASSTTIAGPVSVYGGDIILNNNINASSGNGNILLQASTELTLESAVSLSSGSGAVTLTTPRIDGANFSDTAPNGTLTINSTGVFTLQPFTDSFNAFFMAGNNTTPGGRIDIGGSITSDNFTGSGESAWLRVNNVSNLGGLILGKPSLTSGVANGFPWSIVGPITIYGSIIEISSNLTSTGAGADILIKGTDAITVAASRTLQTNGGDVILWADSDASGSETLAGGTIALLNASSITTAGGNVVLAGGTDTNSDGIPDGYAIGAYATVARGAINASAGLSLDNAIINAGTGDVILKGQGTGNLVNFQIGTRLYGGAINGANITVDAIGSIRGASSSNWGLSLEGFTMEGTGTISLTGLGGRAGSANTDANQVGVEIRRAMDNLSKHSQVKATGSGTIVINGTGGSGTFATANVEATGIRVEASQTNPILSADGDITLNGTSGFSGRGPAISNRSPITSTNGDIILEGFQSTTGTLNLNGNIEINGTITTSADISFETAGAVTQNAALTANNLSLNGAGAFTLQNSSNNVATLAGGASGTRLGNIAYRDADALEIGTVASQSGIFSSGTILVETESGNLTLSQMLNSTSTSDDAIILNAGRTAAAGTGAGGDIVVSGSPTISIDVAARAKLYSGVELNSNGLTNLVGGLTNTRTGFDENNTISPALVDNNAYAIYRVSSGSGNLIVVASGGELQNSTWAYDSNSGTITTIANTANINASDVETFLTSGNLRIEARDISINTALTSNSSNQLTFEASQYLNIGANVSNIGTGETIFQAEEGIRSAVNQSIRIATGGDISFVSDKIAFDGFLTSANARTTTINSTGILTIKPFNTNFHATTLAGSDGFTGSEVDWSGTINGSGHFINTNSTGDFNNLIIENFASLGGLVLNSESSTTKTNIRSNIAISGSITVYGGEINVNSNLTSTAAGGDIVIKGSDGINVADSQILQTNNADVIFWSDSDASGQGAITLGDSTTINTTNGSTLSGLSGGGKIIVAGGADNGNNGGTANDGIPDGFATSSLGNGIKLGATSANYTQMYSGGGDIILRGSSNHNSSTNPDEIGIWHIGSWTANSGNGSISITGNSQNFYGVNFVNTTSASTTGPKLLSIISNKNTGDAIFINGSSASSHGVVFNYDNPKEILATGGGNITINGTGAGSNYGIFLQNQDILASSGSITLDGGVRGTNVANAGTRLGSKSGSNITTSSSNVKFVGDVFNFIATTNFNSSGTLTIEPSSASFSNAIIFPITNLSLASTISGLTLGKPTNTANITFGANTTIAGPISAYGGNINVNFNLNTSSVSGGDILLKASDNITLNASKSITTDGGAVTLWSNNDSNGGHIYIHDNVNIDTRTASDRTANNGSIDDENGGAITLGGGAGTSTPTGYALNNSNSFRGGINLGTESGGGRHNSGISFISGGGDISLKGQQSSTMNGDAAGINAYEGFVLDGGKTGSISLVGDISGSSASFSDGMNLGNFATTAGGTASYIKTVNGNISLTGTSGSGSTQSRGVLLAGGGAGIFVQSIGTGDITITGTPGGGAGTPYNILLIGANILANSGSIELIGGSTGTIYSSSFASTIGYKSVSDITSSSSDITVTADKFDLTSGIEFNTSGTLNIRPTVGNSFINTLSTSQLSYSSDVSGLTIGHADNTANIIFGTNTTIAGPITAYGGIITLDANLTTTNGGNISIYSDNPLGSLSTPRSLTAAGAFKYIPRGTAFTAAVTYPITNLTAISTGLTIGKTTNDKNITINSDVTGAAGIELYGGDIAINGNLKTTNSGNMVLKGNTTIAAGKYIESNGNFTHDGDITFKSNATGTAAFGTLGGTFTTTSGVAKTERYIPAKRAFRFLSPSVNSTGTIRDNWQEAGSTAANLGTHITGTGGATNGFDVTASNNPSLFTHDNANGTWAAVTNTNTNMLSAGTPYRLMVRGDRLISMTTNTPTATVTTLRASGALKTGDFSPTLNQAADGYSFIGNPYQAPVNIKTVLAAATDVNNAVVYYWDPTLNLRGGWVARDLTNNENNVTSDFNEFIQPNQAVFVKNNASVTAPALTFTETDKAIANAAAGVFRTNNNTALLRLKLMASIDNQMQEIDGALVLFNEDYSWDVTQDDITKMGNLDEQVSFKVNNTELAIASQNNPIANAVLPISFSKNRQENYQWEFELENYNGLTPYLFDALTQSYTQIENGTNVTFTTANQDAEAIANRFTVVFQSNLSTTDYLQNIALYPNPAKANQTEFILQGVDTNSSVTIFNLLGQQIPVGVETLENSLRVTPKTNLSKGVYLVTIKTNQGSTSIKWIIE